MIGCLVSDAALDSCAEIRQAPTIPQITSLATILPPIWANLPYIAVFLNPFQLQYFRCLYAAIDLNEIILKRFTEVDYTD